MIYAQNTFYYNCWFLNQFNSSERGWLVEITLVLTATSLETRMYEVLELSLESQQKHGCYKESLENFVPQIPPIKDENKTKREVTGRLTKINKLHLESYAAKN